MSGLQLNYNIVEFFWSFNVFLPRLLKISNEHTISKTHSRDLIYCYLTVTFTSLVVPSFVC